MVRVAARANPRRQQVSQGEPLPVPVQGWDAISPLAGMPPLRAVQLDNWIPRPGYLELRKGSIEHSDTQESDPVESLMAYNGMTDLSFKLFGASGTTIWDHTSVGNASSVVTTVGNARFQHVNFTTTGGAFLWVCNGATAPRYYDGASWQTAVITDITAASIINAAVYKSRIWLTLEDQLDAWYLPTDSIQGAATRFPLSSVFQQGGYLMAIGTWNVDGGDGPDDRICFVSSRGEVAVYAGTSPGFDFSHSGTYPLSPPIGRRCLRKVGGELVLTSIDGLLPLSRALAVERGAILNVAITQNIQPVVNQAAQAAKGNFGWQLMSYPTGTLALLNVPLAEGAQQEQYVMNTVTGAWCRFNGWNANVLEVFKDRLFFGGNDGIVREADKGGSDDGEPIVADVQTAFSYTSLAGRQKRWLMARANMTTNGIVIPGFALNTDFDARAPLTMTSLEFPPAAQWDVAVWDQALWPIEQRIVGPWLGIGGVGYAASLRMRVAVNTQQTPVLQINSFDWIFEPGAMM